MPQINLLPWREELRRRRQKEFGVTVVIAVVLMLGVLGGVHWHFQQRIEFQQQRNEFLQSHIAKLNKQIKEIKNLKRQRERLLARTEKIQQLQSGRPDIVHLMDELVKTLPEGVYFTKVEQKGRRLTLTGVAQSNARVSSLMRQLDASDWLENPALLEIKALKGKQGDVRNSQFSLVVTQTKRKKPADEQVARVGKG